MGQQPIIGDEHNPPEKYVTISVDDGHPTDLRSVDLLHKYGLKATFYVPGANGERTVMKACEIREIDRQFEVGSHTLNHLRLTRLPVQTAWREICDGKKFSEDTVEEIPRIGGTVRADRDIGVQVSSYDSVLHLRGATASSTTHFAAAGDARSVR